MYERTFEYDYTDSTTQQLRPHNLKFALIMCTLRKFIDIRNDLERNELK